MLFNIELENVRTIEICLEAIEAGDYALITKVLNNYQPDKQDIRLLVARAIQLGDLRAIQAVAKSEVDYLQCFKGSILTMWAVAHECIEPSQWGSIMKWVTDEDFLVAQRLAIQTAKVSVHSATQCLMNGWVGNLED